MPHSAGPPSRRGGVARRALLRAAAGLAAAAIAGAPAAEPGTAAIAVTDDTGAVVRLQQPARRIVSLSPHLTEQLYAVGAGGRIVGTTDFADWPPAARAIPRVARAHAVDLERVAALQPDLIVAWGSGFPPATLAALGRLGVPVFIDEPASLEGIATTLERLGRLSGGDGHAPARALREAVAALRARHPGPPTLRVFYQVWTQPLMTLGRDHVVTEALRVCGARNVFDRLPALAPQVSVEAVIAADPDVLVTAEPGGIDRGALRHFERYPALRAVRARRFVVLDADRINRHTPRIVEEIARLCERLEAFRAAPAN